MNGIVVPKQYKSELRNNQTPEYTEAIIRDYVLAHPGEVITGDNFKEITSLSTGHEHARWLVKQGKLIRKRLDDGTKGVRFTYEWFTMRPHVPQHSGVTVSKGDVTVTQITDLIIRYTENGGADDAASLFRFRNYLMRESK